MPAEEKELFVHRNKKVHDFHGKFQYQVKVQNSEDRSQNGGWKKGHSSGAGSGDLGVPTCVKIHSLILELVTCECASHD